MSQTNPSNLPANPFIVGPKIGDPRLFVGRKDELQAIINCMDGAQPTSINIVGERRIGKTSLLYHLEQTWTNRVRDASRFVLIRLSMQKSGMCKKRGFFNTVAQELLRQPLVSGRSDLVNALQKNPMKGPEFADAMAVFDQKGLLPVLCLDEFHKLFDYPKEFDDDFYDGLRSVMDESHIVMIAATPVPIMKYKRKHRLTSTFFNQARTISLKRLKPDEVKDLLSLPASGVPSALNPRERQLAHEWSNTTHPYILQMAADALCQARLTGRNEAWARKKFNEEVRKYDRWGWKRSSLLRCLHSVFWKFPARIGLLVRRTGTEIDNVTNWIMGLFLIIFLVLIFLGAIKPNELLEIVRRIVGFLRISRGINPPAESLSTLKRTMALAGFSLLESFEPRN